MRYHQDKNNKYTYVVVAALFLFFIYLNRGYLTVLASDILSFISVPIFEAKGGVVESSAGWMEYLKDKNTITAENIKLKEELAGLRLLPLKIKTLEDENTGLRQMTGWKGSVTVSSTSAEVTDKKYDFIPANVLSGPVVPPYEVMILGAGRQNGVLEGDMVLAGDNLAIGEIVSVSLSTSKARLFSAFGVVREVAIDGKGGVLRSVAKGFGGGNFYIELPTEYSVAPGDSVSLGGGKYILGSIGFVTDKESGSSRRALFSYPINPKELRYVKIIKGEVETGNE